MSAPVRSRLPQSTKWMFTIHTDETPTLETLFNDPAKVEYALYGIETGKENGRRHLQGLVVFKQRLGGPSAKKLFRDDTVHLGDKDGHPVKNLPAAYEYCTKDGDVHEFGERPSGLTQRAPRDDWVRARDLAKVGDFTTIIDELPHMVKYLQHLAQVPRVLCPAKITLDGDLADRNFWIWGAPGSGKSKFVREKEGSRLYVTGSMGRFMWARWNPQVHEAVLFDDLNTWSITPKEVDFWLKVFDRYEIYGEAKGGIEFALRPLRVYVTSNFPLAQCVPKENLDAFQRRFTEICLNQRL